MNEIEHFIEPHRLLLVWLPPIDERDRTRRVVGELVLRDDRTVILRYSTKSDDFKAARRLGFDGYPAFPLTNSEHREGVLDAFLARLPPKSRADFKRYLKNHAIGEHIELSDFALLGYCGGNLPSDSFRLVHPFDDAPVPCEFALEVAGAHYYLPDNTCLATGTQVTFVAEPENPRDSRAIRVEVEGQTVGYVSRAQTEPFHGWLLGAVVEGEIERINGPPERPRVTVFVRVSEFGRRPRHETAAA